MKTVDIEYFQKELKILSESLENRSPAGVARYLTVLAKVAEPAIPEAKPDPQPNLRECWVKFEEGGNPIDSYRGDVFEGDLYHNKAGEWVRVREVTPNPKDGQ